MEILDKENQLIAVEKVLEEMQKAEECVNSWNSSWWEQCLDAYSMSLYHTGMADVQDIEKRYHEHYKLPNVYYPENRTGEPLRKVILEDDYGKEYECEFGRIDWYGMNSHKSTRRFSFNNNGIVEFSKSTKAGQKQTPQHPRRISYNTLFNVLSNDFEISITLDQLTDDWREKYKYDYLSLSLKGNILIEKFNDTEIMRDLSTGMRLVRIVKKYDKRNRQNNASVAFEAALNPDDSLEYGAVAVETHKGNGKVNGTYRFDVSRKKGVRANFYSRKGVKVDLTSNPVLLGTANTLLLPQANSDNSGDIIVSNFANSTQVAIAKNLSEKAISFDNSDFNMQSVNQAERRIIEMVKCIRGELPLPGLIDRIDNCLEIIDKKQNVQIGEESNCKVLKLESPNK